MVSPTPSDNFIREFTTVRRESHTSYQQKKKKPPIKYPSSATRRRQKPDPATWRLRVAQRWNGSYLRYDVVLLCLSNLFMGIQASRHNVWVLQLRRSHQSCSRSHLKLQRHENISKSNKNVDLCFAALFLTFKQTSLALSQCCLQNNSTHNDEITSQRHSWWDSSSLCAERVREPRPQQSTQQPTQTSLTAEGFLPMCSK